MLITVTNICFNRDAGGSFSKKEKAVEDQYFRRQVSYTKKSMYTVDHTQSLIMSVFAFQEQEQLEKLKSIAHEHHEEEIGHHEESIKELQVNTITLL